jgi:hypothetical protein
MKIDNIVKLVKEEQSIISEYEKKNDLIKLFDLLLTNFKERYVYFNLVYDIYNIHDNKII